MRLDYSYVKFGLNSKEEFESQMNKIQSMSLFGKYEVFFVEIRSFHRLCFAPKFNLSVEPVFDYMIWKLDRIGVSTWARRKIYQRRIKSTRMNMIPSGDSLLCWYVDVLPREHKEKAASDQKIANKRRKSNESKWNQLRERSMKRNWRKKWKKNGEQQSQSTRDKEKNPNKKDVN